MTLIHQHFSGDWGFPYVYVSAVQDTCHGALDVDVRGLAGVVVGLESARVVWLENRYATARAPGAPRGGEA